jgi:ubiquinone/menaquinone biosynthesis C-methylase UbiE
VAVKGVDYDEIAPNYDRRYEDASREGARGVASVLSRQVHEVAAKSVVEVGCGTGFWLGLLRPIVPALYGLDLSVGMLRRARERDRDLPLVRATSATLPFAPACFDFVYCVNAVHHFSDAAGFVREARRCSRPGAALTIIGMNPHAALDRWYIYDYFPGTLQADLERYPSPGAVSGWMRSAGFERIESAIAHRIVHQFAGRDVLDDPILRKDGTSQLVLLSDDAYAAGLERIEGTVTRAEATGERLVFQTDISLATVTGRVP